jgi:hypothetical protein
MRALVASRKTSLTSGTASRRRALDRVGSALDSFVVEVVVKVHASGDEQRVRSERDREQLEHVLDVAGLPKGPPAGSFG